MQKWGEALHFSLVDLTSYLLSIFQGSIVEFFSYTIYHQFLLVRDDSLKLRICGLVCFFFVGSPLFVVTQKIAGYLSSTAFLLQRTGVDYVTTFSYFALSLAS